MSAPTRFLFVAVAGWALFRGATAGMLPGIEAFTIARAEAAPPPIVPTEFAPIAPPAPQPAAVPGAYPGYPPYGAYPPAPQYAAVPTYYYPASAPLRRVTVPLPPAPQPAEQSYGAPPEFYAPIPQLGEWDLAQFAGRSVPAPQSIPAPIPAPSFIPRKHLDRMQLSTWALLRSQPGTGSLASGGTLGGSQAGARLTYAFDPRIAASIRTSTPIGGSTRGG